MTDPTSLPTTSNGRLTACSPEIKSSWAQNWYSSVKGAVVVDKKTVRIELKNPWPIGPGVYASLRGATMYPTDADKKFNIKTEAIGTGAYKLKEFVPADRVVYERNPNYRNKDFPKNDGIFGKIMLDEDARIAAVRSGTVDFAQLSPEGAQKLAGIKGYQILAGRAPEHQRELQLRQVSSSKTRGCARRSHSPSIARR
jgi:ABC-type transport system substrate-binding protein